MIAYSPLIQAVMQPILQHEEGALSNHKLLAAKENILKIIQENPTFQKEGESAIQRINNHIQTNIYYVQRRKSHDPFFTTFQCVRLKDYEGLMFLVRIGADISSFDTTGMAPIHIAALKNDAKAMEILKLHPQFDPSLKAKNNKTAALLSTSQNVKIALKA